jgi:hypothetical protein
MASRWCGIDMCQPSTCRLDANGNHGMLFEVGEGVKDIARRSVNTHRGRMPLTSAVYGPVFGSSLNYHPLTW